MKKTEIILLLLITVLAILFRFVKIGEYPVHLTIDEAAIGINAFSILETGKDEWGELLPLAFRSVGDYKPPINIYLTTFTIALFGLGEFAVRFPSALLGSLTPLVFVLVLKELKVSRVGYLFGGLWFALSPWHIHFSRGSFEAVTALFFMLTGLLFFIKWSSQARTRLLTASIILFSLSVWSYHSTRFFVPLAFAYLLYIYRSKTIKLFKYPKKYRLPWFVAILFATPFLYLSLFSEAIKTRALSTSILREPSLARNLHFGDYGSVSQFVFDNDLYLILRHWAGKYLNYYDFKFWFWDALFTEPGFPDIGLMLAVNIPIFVLGVYSLAKSKNTKLLKIAAFWFFAGPLPASLAMNEQHTLRAFIWLPFFGFILVLGFERLVKVIRKPIITYIYFLALALNFLYFLDIYTTHYPRQNSEYWQYGYKEIAQITCVEKNNVKEIIISPVFGSEGPLITGIPYAYVLFYCRYDPAEFLATRTSESKETENIVYRRPNPQDLENENSIIVASPWDIPDEVIDQNSIIKKIYFLNGKLGFNVIKTK